MDRLAEVVVARVSTEVNMVSWLRLLERVMNCLHLVVALLARAVAFGPRLFPVLSQIMRREGGPMRALRVRLVGLGASLVLVLTGIGGVGSALANHDDNVAQACNNVGVAATGEVNDQAINVTQGDSTGIRGVACEQFRYPAGTPRDETPVTTQPARSAVQATGPTTVTGPATTTGSATTTRQATGQAAQLAAQPAVVRPATPAQAHQPTRLPRTGGGIPIETLALVGMAISGLGFGVRRFWR